VGEREWDLCQKTGGGDSEASYGGDGGAGDTTFEKSAGFSVEDGFTGSIYRSSGMARMQALHPNFQSGTDETI